MGAFRQKKRNAPVFLSEPYETVSLMKNILSLKEKKYFLLRKLFLRLEESSVQNY